MHPSLQNRRTLRSIVLALGLMGSFGATAAEPPKGVMDYYRQIPERLFPRNHKYELKRTDAGWVTQHPDTEEELLATVDSRNGYIEVEAEGGDGRFTLQAALFLKADKTPLFALSEWGIDGTESETGRLVLLAPERGQWTVVTPRMLPKLGLSDFIEPRCLAALSTDAKAMLEAEGIVFTLPQKGTSVQASVKLTEYTLGGEEAPAATKAACPLGKTSRTLKWDKKAGRFSLEAKAAGKK